MQSKISEMVKNRVFFTKNFKTLTYSIFMSFKVTTMTHGANRIYLFVEISWRALYWRARTCARAPVEYSYSVRMPKKKTLFLTFSWRVEVRARRARKYAHTRNFFIIQKYYKKSLSNSFLLLISQKLTILAQFEFCWNIQNPQNGLKYTFFLSFWSILGILNFSAKFKLS